MKVREFLLLLVVGLLSFLAAADAATKTILEGIELPAFRTVDGVQLKRNGQGLRSFSFFGASYKMYVAGIWSLSRLVSGDDVLNNWCENTNKRKQAVAHWRWILPS